MTVFEMNYNTWYRKAVHGWDLPDTIKADADMIGWDPASGATLESVENDWRVFRRLYESSVVWRGWSLWPAMLAECRKTTLASLRKEFDYLAFHEGDLLALVENVWSGVPDGRDWTVGALDLKAAQTRTIGHFDRMSPTWMLERGIRDA
jgi:hypothetical protein